MNHRLVRIVLLMSLAAAACRGDRAAEEEQGSAGFVLPGEEAYVSPEDSATAEADARAHSQAIRDSLRRAAGDEADEDAPAAPSSGDAPAARYEACMRQAAQAEGPVRERLARACENIRAQPDAPAP